MNEILISGVDLMLAQPSSRLIFGILPWYSFLIVCGMVIALLLAIREEKRRGLPQDTVLTLVLWMIPAAIIGARLYFVLFSWSDYADDPVSILYIWEGGLAIYGGLITGLITIVIYCRIKKVSVLTVCDLIAPGLALAQGIGRWGNYFNMEAFGLEVTDPSLQFFPFAVLINENGGQVWHMATFFYESLADILIGLFLLAVRHRMMKKNGDTFFWYVLLYGAARLVTENFRMDSLYSGSFRISQILSVLMCIGVLIYFTVRMIRDCRYTGRKEKTVLWSGVIVSVLLFLRLYSNGGNADPFLFYRLMFFLLFMVVLTDMILIICFNSRRFREMIAPVLQLMILVFWYILYRRLTESSFLSVGSSALLLILFSICSVMTGAIVYHKITEGSECL